MTRTLSLLLLVGLVSTSAAAKRPNILFIFADDHGYQAMSCYGSKVNKTPNLDRIAKGGMRFNRCFVTNSICGPSRAVVLTGKYSHLNGFARNGDVFNGSQQHVAKLLRKSGYETAVIGKWHLRSNPTGFDYWHILIGQGPYYNPRMKTPDGTVKHTGYTTDIITDEALKWLKGRKADKPFFLMYQHKAPHRNWQPGPKYLNKYDGIDIPEPPTLFDDYKGRGTAARVQEMTVARHLSPNDLKLVPQRGLTDKQRKIWDAAYSKKNEAFRQAKLTGKALIRWKYQRYAKDYLRCIDSLDENVGRVLDYLDESGLAKNTVVIYSSDQGWYLGEHGWYDKRWMYEESFRTPFVVRWPGKIKPGSVNDDLVMNLDFAQTFLDIAGVKAPTTMQGASLKPVMEGKTPKDWRDAVYYHYYEHPGPHMVHRHYGVRTARHKLIYFYQLKEWELYDLKTDPHELKSVYAEPRYAKVVQDLKKRLSGLRQQYGDRGQVVDFAAANAKNVKTRLVFSLPLKGVKGKVISFENGKAVELKGEGAIVRRGGSGKLNPRYKPMTVSSYCRLDGDDGVVIAQGGVSLGYSLFFLKRVPHFAVRSGGQLKIVKGEAIPKGKFVQLIAVLNREGVGQIYVDGKKSGKAMKLGFVRARPADGLSVGADTGSHVGSYKTDLPFRGAIGRLKVYWGELSKDRWGK